MPMETREVLSMLASASRRPQNRLVVKFKGLILSQEKYDKKDGSQGYKYQLYHSESKSVISFTSARLLKEGEPAEVALTLNGFTAYEK